MIGTRSQRRWLNLAGVAVVVGLMAYALYAQHVLGLDPCPLCIFQRIAMMAVGLVLLIAGLHAPAGKGARVYAVLGLLVALTGAGISIDHIRVQHLPQGQIATCGPGLGYMLDAFPFANVLKMVLSGSGECSTINWKFLGLTMPAWVLVWFLILATLAVVTNWRAVRR